MPKLPKLFIHLSSSDVQKGDIPPLAGEMSPFHLYFQQGNSFTLHLFSETIFFVSLHNFLLYNISLPPVYQ